MSDKEFAEAAAQRLVVKNKKYKKGDIFAIAVCLLAALLIWIHATNLEKNEEALRNEQVDDRLELAQMQE